METQVLPGPQDETQGGDIKLRRGQLPRSCPGCGALTQDIEPHLAGFYSRSRRAVRTYLKQQKKQTATTATPCAAHTGPDFDKLKQEDGPVVDDAAENEDKESEALKIPYCDRCHDLIHNARGYPIAHPSLDDIADSIAESSFKRNHVYHVLDAADFPMSLIPDLFHKIELAKPRSQNRRSQHDFSSKPTLSFIITRSDLLGSTKKMVDSMMTYFQTVLREALGRTGRNMRLGNVHLVSAKRGWWTKEIKDDIWRRGGANWMVGKVNVGKSNLFEVLFPKGSGDRAPVHAALPQQQSHVPAENAERPLGSEDEYLENGLLPPPQPESPFPVFPIVSSLPGTTASPIRIPFAGHRGELIDLPGLSRGNLEQYVEEESRLDLIMTHRENVDQHIIKAGQSLILGGGLIRITPRLDSGDRSITVLAYPFVPLTAHVTSTEKACSLQMQTRDSVLASVLAKDAGTHMASAGVLELNTDVTKVRAGPLVRSGVAVSKLPFRVYATDVLIEGVGWIELVCQVRRRSAPPLASGMPVFKQEQSEATEAQPGFAPFTQQPPLPEESAFEYPKIEVFSPKGRYVSQRQSLQAWIRWADGHRQKHASKLRRPRKSMKGRTR